MARATHPQLGQGGDGLGGVAGQQVVQQAEGAEGVVDPVEGVRLQRLDHVPLEVERGEGGEASQRAAAQVPDTDTPQLGVTQCRAVEVSKKFHVSQ